MASKEDLVDNTLKLASRVQCTAVRIYNNIRAVGHGELTADNALHQLVEDYHELKDIGNDLSELSDKIEKELK